MERNKLGQFKKQYVVDEFFFDEINTEEKAYILGFLYADGCNFTSKTGQKSFQFTQLEQDLDILEQIKEKLKTNYPYHIEVQKTNGKKKYVLKIFSNRLCDNLSRLGVTPKKSLTLTFPKIKEDLIPHFIRGYFDGDGCIWMGKPKLVTSFDKKLNKEYTKFNLNTKFTFSGCSTFITKLQEYLIDNIGLRKTKLNKSHGIEGFCVMEYSGRGNIKKLYDLMYNNATIFGARKKQKFEEIFCADTKKLVYETRLIAEKSLES